MLPIQAIREHTKNIISGLKKRNISAADMVEKALALDQLKRSKQQQRDKILSEINVQSRQIGKLMQQHKHEDAEALKKGTVQLKRQSSILENELKDISDRLDDILYHIPNVPHPDVPQGKSAEDNVEISRAGDIPKLAENAVPHWDLIKKYDIIDFDLGSKITSSGFPVYKGKGARLQRALITFFLDKAVEKGYKEIQPPILVNEPSAYGTGQLPDKERQMYHIEKDNLYLIPTAEVSITNLYRNTIVPETDLPIKNVGYTPCFRREAGSWGAHVRGLNRLHQFDKVEIVQITKAQDSTQVLTEMCDYVEELLALLELPYRKMLLCGSDLGVNASITYDMEVYAAAQQKWLEVSSVSNFEAFQANRLKLRFKNRNNLPELLHTLNGSALALPRIVASLLENNQTERGIHIPKALIPYTGFDRID